MDMIGRVEFEPNREVKPRPYQDQRPELVEFRMRGYFEE